MDQRNVNEDQLKYLGKPISDINSLGNIFSEEELKIINKYGAWMEALAGREIEPITPEQKRFVDVSVGIAEPKSEYEKIWMKIIHARNDHSYVKYQNKSKIIWDEQKNAIRKIPKNIKDYLDRHLLDIESREDISIKEKSDKIKEKMSLNNEMRNSIYNELLKETKISTNDNLFNAIINNY